jgi:hypothetical protein
MNCTDRPILLGSLNQENELSESCSAFWGETEMHEHVLWVKANEISHVEDTGLGENIILKWILKKSNGREWTGMISFWIRPIGRSCAKGYKFLGHKKWGWGSFD